MPSIDRTKDAATWRVRHRGQSAREPDEALAYIRAGLLMDPTALERFNERYGTGPAKRKKPASKRHEPPLLQHEQTTAILQIGATISPHAYWLLRLMLTYGHRPVTMPGPSGSPTAS